MSKPSGGPTSGRSGAPEPSKSDRDLDLAETAGKDSEAGSDPSPGDRGPGEASTTEECPAIDLESVRDRAS
jgi:hypothetical protein